MKYQDDDLTLINELKDGKQEAYALIFEEFFRIINLFCKRLIKDDLAAEDIAADTFLTLWKLRENFSSKQSIKAFLFITARNRCLNHLRHIRIKKSHQQHINYLLQHEEQLQQDVIREKEIREEFFNRIYAEIEHLPPQTSRVLKMAYINGKKNAEIAEELKISIHTVKNIKAYGLKMLIKATKSDYVILYLLLLQYLEK